MLALIKADAIVDPAIPEGGTVQVAEGVAVAPAEDGWEFEDYRLTTIVFPTPPSGNYSTAIELVGGIPTAVYTSVAGGGGTIDDQITSAPGDLFGGPTLGEIFNVD